jgi:hypothetical protein
VSPKRIQLSRQKGWRKPPNTVVVSRPSGWGNPFKIGELYRFDDPTEGLLMGVVVSHEDAVRLFRRYLNARPDHAKKVRDELAGKDLACWCRSDQLCHADALLEVANSLPAGAAAVSSREGEKA